MYIRIKCSYTLNTHAHLNEHTHTRADNTEAARGQERCKRERARGVILNLVPKNVCTHVAIPSFCCWLRLFTLAYSMYNLRLRIFTVSNTLLTKYFRFCFYFYNFSRNGRCSNRDDDDCVLADAILFFSVHRYIDT